MQNIQKRQCVLYISKKTNTYYKKTIKHEIERLIHVNKLMSITFN